MHRDLKPANVMLTKSRREAARLRPGEAAGPASADLDVRHAALTTRAPATAHGTILGTMQYMAPEQFEGKEADARSDIWALGAVIYEMVTGTRPFEGETPASVIGAILKDQPPPISTRQPLAPTALDRLVRRVSPKIRTSDGSQRAT